jgi:hypothetical protein
MTSTDTNSGSEQTRSLNELVERDKAFEEYINASEGYGLAFARECWNRAWAVASTKPVMVELEKCARTLYITGCYGADDSWNNKDGLLPQMREHMYKTARAVLDAANVRYVE